MVFLWCIFTLTFYHFSYSTVQFSFHEKEFIFQTLLQLTNGKPNCNLDLALMALMSLYSHSLENFMRRCSVMLTNMNSGVRNLELRKPVFEILLCHFLAVSP